MSATRLLERQHTHVPPEPLGSVRKLLAELLPILSHNARKGWGNPDETTLAVKPKKGWGTRRVPLDKNEGGVKHKGILSVF